MTRDLLVQQLESSRQYFNRMLSAFTEDDSGYAPDPEMYSVAAHVEHAAETIDWFVHGVFGSHWDMDFVAASQRANSARSLERARLHLDSAYDAAVSAVQSAEDIGTLLPADDPILPGQPTYSFANGLADHSAHHRGSLAVYARLLGRIPQLIYAG